MSSKTNPYIGIAICNGDINNHLVILSKIIPGYNDKLRPIELNLCLSPFLSLADMSCRSRLATLNEKLTALERRIEYIEARVSISLSNEFSSVIFIVGF